MKKKRLFVMTIILCVVLLLSGCWISGNSSKKVNIPKHEPLEKWQINADGYIKQLENLLENNFSEISIKIEEEGESSLGSKSTYFFENESTESIYTFSIDILSNKEGYINQIVLSAYKELSKKDETDRETLFELYASCCTYAAVMTLGAETELNENVKEISESLMADGYILDLNVKYEMIDNGSLGMNAYISPIDGGFKISDAFDK